MTEAEKRETVIRWLEACNRLSYNGSDCQNCPYYDDEDTAELPFGICNIQDMFDDALALLKEQEARVMTWDEMIAAGKEEKAVFVEECPEGDPVRCFWGIAFPGMELPKDVPFNYPGGVDFNVTDVDGDIWDGDFYGMNAPLGWRAWTSRPSPEQMRDTKWEGDSDAE